MALAPFLNSPPSAYINASLLLCRKTALAPTVGTRRGPFLVKSSLAEGGMGIVFRALDTKLQRDVALKLLPDHFADDPERLARFRLTERRKPALVPSPFPELLVALAGCSQCVHGFRPRRVRPLTLVERRKHKTWSTGRFTM